MLKSVLLPILALFVVMLITLSIKTCQYTFFLDLAWEVQGVGGTNIDLLQSDA